MIFNREYSKYWESAVSKSVDGTVIPGVAEAKHFLDDLEISRADRILDLGCSFGRMFEPLSHFSEEIFGIDLDPYAVEKAGLKPYRVVRQGAAEETGFPDAFFDVVFCWAVFDVVDHAKGLVEANRILKDGGKYLFTGKNNNYCSDDILAWKAEKNAFLKNFPNKFTSLIGVLKSFKSLGFKLDRLVIFPRRGDFGILNYVDIDVDAEGEYIGYEYLIVCHKVGVVASNLDIVEPLHGQHSKTAISLSAKAGFSVPMEFFESIGID